MKASSRDRPRSRGEGLSQLQRAENPSPLGFGGQSMIRPPNSPRLEGFPPFRCGDFPHTIEVLPPTDITPSG